MGRDRVAIIDPGPDVESHVRALTLAVELTYDRKIILTHGHADHAGSARSLSVAIGAEVCGPNGIEEVDHIVVDGDVIETDEGNLIVVHTPGHTEEHLCFYWEAQRALFAGDHLLGKGNTTWVADYSGCVSDYLNSIDQLHALNLAIIYPAHGPPLENPPEALARFESHRRARIRQVEEALEEHPSLSTEKLLAFVYGDTLPPGMERAAAQSLEALRDHVRTLGES